MAAPARALRRPARHLSHAHKTRNAIASRALDGRVERLYTIAVSFALGVVGTALGFAFGVVPYFRETLDLTRYDSFFLISLIVGTTIGFIVGVANGARWYRATESSPLVQRRMLAYMRRHAGEELGSASRTLNPVTLRALLGHRRRQQQA